MCGIVGYIGTRGATTLLIDGLKRLEYRGYDSAGVAIMNGKGVETRKVAGKISRLENVVATQPVHGTLGIAHTRWATHGAPTEGNAHPHMCCEGKIAVVHNGIIENATALRKTLEERGHKFTSETDTEVIAHLIEELFDGNLEEAVIEALLTGRGHVRHRGDLERRPEQDRRRAEGQPAARRSRRRRVLRRERRVRDSRAHARRWSISTTAIWRCSSRTATASSTSTRREQQKKVSKIDWDLDQIERGGFAHFMLKEIFEQPTTIENAMRGRLLREEGTSKLGGLNLTDEELLTFDNIVITACGTSWHSALIGEHMIEELTRVPVEVEYASEFRYRNPIVNERTLCIVISQSGETADTLAAMREAKRRGARTLGIVNVVGSTIAREADGGIYIHAGPGDRRRVDEGVHEPGDRAAAVHAQARPAARHVHSPRSGDHRRHARAAAAGQADSRSRAEDRGHSPRSSSARRTSCTSGAATISRPHSRARSS